AGLTRDDMVVILTTSAEYRGLVGGLSGLWVGKLYQDLLGRPASQPEINVWVAALQNGLSSQDLVRVLLGSGEYRQREAAAIVPQLDQQLLGRPASAQDISFWAACRVAGISHDDMVVLLLLGDEYWQRATS